MINPGRCENRLKATNLALSKDPENADLKAKKLAQEIALQRKEDAYPKLLGAHLKKCAENGQEDAKGRTKKLVRDLKAGIKEVKKLGTGNG